MRAKISISFLIVSLTAHAYCMCLASTAGECCLSRLVDSLRQSDSPDSDDYVKRMSEYISGNGSSINLMLDSLRRERKSAATDTLCDICEADSVLTLAERNKKLYDNFSEYLNQRKFTKFLRKIFLRPERDTTMLDKVIDERLQFIPLTGYRIANIDIEPRNIYTNPKSLAQKFMMGTHVRTRRMTVRQDLMFGVGDTLDPTLIVENLQLLRSRSVFYDVHFVIEPVDAHSTNVNVRVVSRDKWTMGFGGRANGSGKAYGEISESNFLGFGSKLKYRLSMDWRKMKYHGSLFSYNVPNLLGSFYGSEMDLGRSFDHRIANIKLSKEIMVPNDYELGGQITAEQVEFQFVKANAADTIYYADMNFWTGFSHKLPDTELSIFSMLRYYNVKYFKRNRIVLNDTPLLVDAFNNPYFHNRQFFLASVGLYYQSSRMTTNVYQYGIKENIPIGVNAEILIGYMEGEFHSGPYIGAVFKRGNFFSFGYMAQKVSYGTFYSELTHKAYQSALNIEIDYFTNLLRLGDFRIRHFVSLTYTSGWNRTDGSNEVLAFTTQSGPRGIREHLIGKKRFTLSNETVLFTPWAPAGFRIVLYGYADIGFIGGSNNMFKNDFYASVGVGLRVRNERLVFKTLQLRLSIGFGKIGLIKNDWFRVNTSYRMESMNFKPEPPEIVPYE